MLRFPRPCLPRVAEWLLLALFVFTWAESASAERKTVCTVTVNSPDEKEAFRAALPSRDYDFVELVEHGRSDWLESACRTGVRCDVLVVSGHYDGGHEFFSDRIEAREFLPVDELERVSCNGACAGLFSQLKEVYLFGCNTLDARPNAAVAGEIERALRRAGLARAEIDRISRSLAARHAQSSRDRMRLVFKDVPAIYGFSSVAPLGPAAASILRRHFQAGGAGEVGSGRASSRLLAQFSAHAMAVTGGLAAGDPLLAHRSDVCQFASDRVPEATKAQFVHALLQREIVEARMFLDRLEDFASALPPVPGRSDALVLSLDGIARDDAVRGRYLALARDTDATATGARMFALAERLDWLTAEDGRAEVEAMFDRRIARNALSPADVDLACALNREGALDGMRPASASGDRVADAALLACLGDAPARVRVLAALTESGDEDARFAQVVVSHRALDPRAELPALLTHIATLSDRNAQARALHALRGQRVADAESLGELVRLFPRAPSLAVQTAIANVLLRSDFATIASPDVVDILRTSRVRGAGGEDAVDVLIRRMQLAQ